MNEVEKIFLDMVTQCVSLMQSILMQLNYVDVVVATILLSLFLVLFYHPLFCLTHLIAARRVSFRKMSSWEGMNACALIQGRRKHYNRTPRIEVFVYRPNLFSTIEIISLGFKKYALLIPESSWEEKHDRELSLLLQPQENFSRWALLPNSTALLLEAVLLKTQKKVFNIIGKNINNKDFREFLTLSTYFFFLPLIYIRLNLRKYLYKKAMHSVYGKRRQKKLSQNLEKEFENFHTQPLTYLKQHCNEAEAANS